MSRSGSSGSSPPETSDAVRAACPQAPAGYPYVMPTLVMDPAPAEIDALIERRRRLDLDHYDEVWEGVLHMNPPPELGEAAVLRRPRC
jgi:hypothetical protein